MLKLEKSKFDAKRYEKVMPNTTAITGIAVDIIPMPRPEMITVAWPILAASLTRRVGLLECEV